MAIVKAAMRTARWAGDQGWSDKSSGDPFRAPRGDVAPPLLLTDNSGKLASELEA